MLYTILLSVFFLPSLWRINSMISILVFSVPETKSYLSTMYYVFSISLSFVDDGNNW